MKHSNPTAHAGRRWLRFLGRVWSGLVLSALLPAASASGFVYETPAEFTATGDFDGDGREDVVIVDRATGNYRVALQPAEGQQVWAAARASGIENVSGFTVGRVLATGRDALVFTSPDANRLNVVEANSPATPGVPLPIFVPTLGPELVVALDIGGGGNTPLEDLLVGSIANNSGAPNQVSLMRNNAAVFTQMGASLVQPTPFAAGNAVSIKTGAAKMAAVLLRNNGSDTFRVYNLAGGSLLLTLQAAGLPANSAFVPGNFTGAALAQFLFFQAGDATGALRSRSVIEPTPGVFALGAETVFNLGSAIQQVFVLAQPSGARLLVIFAGGQLARVYNFDGVNAPTPLQDLAADAGGHFTGAAPLASGDFTMLTADAGASTSSRFKNYHANGGQYSAGTAGALPGLTALTGVANVFQFEAEPFVSATPKLLRSLTAGDWTSRFNTEALPQLSANVETFVSSSNGLDNPTPVPLGSAHPLMHFGLVNQYAAPLSIFSVTTPIGDEVVEVKIAPPAGTYKTSVQVTLTTSQAGAIVQYRLKQSGDWLTYAGPIMLFQDTVVSYYAKPAAGTAKSVIRHAAYHFTEAPGQLDSDGDGVPDFVEVAKGLDPRRGPDSDGDGYSDLDEILQGSDPKSAASMPAGHVELKTSVDFVETPRPIDGVANAVTVSAPGTPVRVYDGPGALLRYGATASLNIPGALNPSVALSNIVIDTRQRLLAVATEQHFDLATPGADKALGRELIGFRPVPEVAAGLTVNYVYGGGPLATEANNWIAAAQAAQGSVTHLRSIQELGVLDTLAALLVERKVGEVLQTRGVATAAQLTLFPFRLTDKARVSLSQSNLLAIEQLGPNGEPAFALRGVYRTATNAVAPANLSSQALRALATDIYRISSASNNAAPGAYPSPVDTLRRFLSTGELPTNYLAASALTPNDRTSAFSVANQILASMQPRPTTNVTLVTRADTFNSDCVPLDGQFGGTTWSLFLPSGEPYRLLENFSLPAGSAVHVFGFTDGPPRGCPGQALEVIALGLDSVPAVGVNDSDGDLLPDDLEMLLFGNLGQNGSGDADGDGISNFQEALEGTDLLDATSKGSAPANVGPPQIELKVVGGQLKVAWSWPEAYAGKIRFSVQATADLGQPFVDVPVSPARVGGDQFEAPVPPGVQMQFYRVSLALK